ncbi:hypothetical protein LNV08_22000 [Paucibacter sp. TC2R-5]|uniref:hypothetical protein n=1 Tax=Paucibacter sp. TC2R-5 TaxID=2893555 RepID=UPI0021E4446F|nr:hypothetical protein [Paucibacter sp. TC2R-5]MCV2361647.1 hypothetical protein [Paucibacter sp. TC2R-5]
MSSGKSAVLARLYVPCDFAGYRTNIEAHRWGNTVTSAFVVLGREPEHIESLRVRMGPHVLMDFSSVTDPETGIKTTGGQLAACMSAYFGRRELGGFRLPMADLPGQGVAIPINWSLSLEIGFCADMPAGKTFVFQELIELG